MNNNNNQTTLLHRFLEWERRTPDAIYLTQPLADGSVQDYSWRQVGDQARRVAAYLQTLDLPAKSSIGLYAKNSAHWIIADLAIWMAGHVSVPLYTTANADTVRYVLKHAEVRLLLVGRLEGDEAGWKAVRTAIPGDLPLIDLPLSSAGEGMPWAQIIEFTAPMQTVVLPAPEDLATIIYTSGSTG
ncbi:MAG: AMP-binding protein, partial [Pseudomonas sp.]